MCQFHLLKPRLATCNTQTWPPPFSFLLKLCVLILHIYNYHSPPFQLNLKHQAGGVTFAHFVKACHCYCCCLRLAKRGRSTVVTKEGCK